MPLLAKYINTNNTARIVFITAIFLVSLSVNAQTFEEKYKSFKGAVIQDYIDFRKKANEDYAAFMKEAWRQYKIAPKVMLPKDYEQPPVDYEGKQNKENNPIDYEGIVPHQNTSPKPQPKPVAPIRENDKNQHYFSFVFYGTEMKVRYNPSLAVKLTIVDGKTLGDVWKKLSSEEYDNLIRDCLELRIRYNLCDWAYYKMLEVFALAACGIGTNEAVILQAYLYAQSGYKMRLALTEQGKLLLLFNSVNMIFDLCGLKLDDGFFYTTEQLKEGEGLNVCDEPFPNESPMSLTVCEPALTADYSPYRTIKAKSCPVETKSRVNKNLMAFFNDYPASCAEDNFMTRWRYYAEVSLADDVRQELYPQISKAIHNNNKLAAANLLLNYVQTGFEYEYDDKVWGHDRVFFAEETLYYPYCDCEDRAILYSRMVRDLLDLDVVLVYYPGHMCAAVNFEDGAHGDYLILDGKTYTIADPTYIGAPVGATMPGMDNKTAKVILLKK